MFQQLLGRNLKFPKINISKSFKQDLHLTQFHENARNNAAVSYTKRAVTLPFFFFRRDSRKMRINNLQNCFSVGANEIKQFNTEKKLLLHVARGEQNDAEAMLKLNPRLLLYRGIVTDFSNRTFTDITALQYAVWALDWHMWEMLLKYLPNEEAKNQLFILDRNKTEHGSHYDFQELIQALKIYLDNFNTWSCEQLGKHWCEVIGGAQTRTVAHVANEFCHPYRSFIPVPNFVETNLPRSLTLVNGSAFFPLEKYSIGELGKDFGVFRWSNEFAGCGTMKPCPNAQVSAETDLIAMLALCKARTEQLEDLKEQFEITPSPCPKFS